MIGSKHAALAQIENLKTKETPKTHQNEPSVEKGVEVRKHHPLIEKRVNQDQGNGVGAAEARRPLLIEVIVTVETENRPRRREHVIFEDLHPLIEVVIVVELPLHQTELATSAILRHLQNVGDEVNDMKNTETDLQKVPVREDTDQIVQINLLIAVRGENHDRRAPQLFTRPVVVEALGHLDSQENQRQSNLPHKQ